jgi:hypothetical protein
MIDIPNTSITNDQYAIERNATVSGSVWDDEFI